MLTRTRLMLPLSCAAAVLVAQLGLAQEQKEEYVGTAEKNVLAEEALAGAEGKIVSINHFKMPAEWVGGKHYHSGPAYVYVLKGTLTIEEEGKPKQNFKAGELYVEPLGTAMQGFHKSADEATEFVVFPVQNEGEPLMHQAE